MPDEPTIPPQQLPNPERLSPNPPITSKQKRWIYLGAVSMLFVVVVFGFFHDREAAKTQPKPTPKPVQKLEAPPPPPTPATVEPSQALAPAPVILPPVPTVPEPVAPAPEKTVKEQIQDDRQRRQNEAMWADNVVSSSNRHESAEPAEGASSLGGVAPQGSPQPVSATKKSKLDFNPDQPTWTLPEGTVINCALVNELNGDFTGPVLAQVSTNVVAPATRVVVIPQGSRIVGEAAKIGGFGQERLAVTFHRLLVPTPEGPYSVSLDKAAPGLDQVGATALKDKVNNHYAQIFGASLAIGAIGGLAQIGNSYGVNGYNAEAQFRNGVTESMAQSSMRVLDRFLNRMPTITIRPGNRINVFLTSDLEIPAYGE